MVPSVHARTYELCGGASERRVGASVFCCVKAPSRRVGACSSMSSGFGSTRALPKLSTKYTAGPTNGLACTQSTFGKREHLPNASAPLILPHVLALSSTQLTAASCLLLSAHVIAVARTILMTALTEVRSNLRSSSAFTVEREATYREPKGLQKFGQSGEQRYWGEAHQIHTIPTTPGPNSYTHRNAFGKQPLSQHKTDFLYSFDRTPRFAYIERSLQKNMTPGPGSYVA